MNRILILPALALAPLLALATGKPPAAPSTSAAANAAATAKAGATADATATGGIAYGSSTTSGDTSLYVLPAPIGGSNLPAGMCQRSKYSHRAFVFNFVSLADGDSFTDLECLGLLMRLEELKRQPLPKPAVEILTAQPPRAEAKPEVAAVTCAPPAKAKTVSAAKQAGACKS